MRTLLISCLSALLFSACGGESAVEVQFAARAGSSAFACEMEIAGDGATINANDLRFYVHDVRALNAAGEEVQLVLDDDGQWQDSGVALLDFEAGCSEMGTAETNTSLRGSLPEGEYSELRFRIGVPEGLNHANAATATAPLNLTSMWWNWSGGYKFFRLEGASSAFAGWRLHLGSTDCSSEMDGTATCENKNVVDVSVPFSDFESGTVVMDLEALLSGSNLGNTEDTAPGCMSGIDDPDCASLFSALGLAHDGVAAGTQSVFSAE